MQNRGHRAHYRQNFQKNRLQKLRRPKKGVPTQPADNNNKNIVGICRLFVCKVPTPEHPCKRDIRTSPRVYQGVPLRDCSPEFASSGSTILFGQGCTVSATHQGTGVGGQPDIPPPCQSQLRKVQDGSGVEEAKVQTLLATPQGQQFLV